MLRSIRPKRARMTARATRNCERVSSALAASVARSTNGRPSIAQADVTRSEVHRISPDWLRPMRTVEAQEGGQEAASRSPCPAGLLQRLVRRVTATHR
jgi:hypothetical protein